MQFLLALVVSGVAVAPSSTALKRSESLLVRAVLSGDTIDVVTIGHVHLLGIEAPSMGRRPEVAAPFGREARDKLAALVLNRWIRLEWEVVPPGARARRSAYVMREDGVFVNAALVREGLAHITAGVSLAYLAELERAEHEARLFRRGIWSRSRERHEVTSEGTARYTAPAQKAPRSGRRSRPTRRAPADKP